MKKKKNTNKPLEALATNYGLCMVSKQISVDGYAVGYMYREEPEEDQSQRENRHRRPGQDHEDGREIEGRVAPVPPAVGGTPGCSLCGECRG